MTITLNDCLTNADLPAPGSESDAPGAPGGRRRPCTVDPREADRLVAAFLAAGHQIKTYPPAYAAKSSQYHVSDPPLAA
jgi:hypothetical protein